jgi:tetratricopeptide (TPR) repeat protein
MPEIVSSSESISTEANSYQALVSRATAHLALDRAEEALEDFERALAIDNQQVFAHLKRFAILLRLDRPEQMLVAANDLLAVTPGEAIGHFHRGIAFGRLGNDEEAIAAYTKALELAQLDSSSYVNRGATYTSLGHFDKALADCEKSLSIKPKQVSALVNKALCLRSTGQPEKAIKACNEVIAIEADCALAYCNRALANFILNRTKQAIADADISIKFAQQPMYAAKCKCIKAKIRAEGGGGGGKGNGNSDDGGGKGTINEARQLCDSAVRMAPENSHPWRYAWSTSALISGMMGDFQAANQNVQLVLDRSSGFIYGINIKARLLLMQQRLDEALVTVNSALALNAKDPESNYIRYLIRSKQADASASEDLTRARELGYLRDDAQDRV